MLNNENNSAKLREIEERINNDKSLQVLKLVDPEEYDHIVKTLTRDLKENKSKQNAISKVYAFFESITLRAWALIFLAFIFGLYWGK